MRLDAIHSFAEELCTMFRIKHGPMDAENEMARELIALNIKMLKMEERIKDLERDRHRAFHREPSVHYLRNLQLPIDDHDWFAPEITHERE